jgi:tetratricopeptide (TPR) repeat protein
VALIHQGKEQEAARHFSEAVRIKPHYAEPHCNLAKVLLRQGKTEEAARHLSEALRIDPRLAKEFSDAAWALATHKDAKLRNGPIALQLAEQACQATGDQQPAILDTLAAAYAEVGRFDEAVATARKALTLALSAEQLDLADGIRERLRLYEARQPFHQAPAETRR